MLDTRRDTFVNIFYLTKKKNTNLEIKITNIINEKRTGFDKYT